MVYDVIMTYENEAAKLTSSGWMQGKLKVQIEAAPLA